MKIRIYQVNTDRDTKNIAFMRYESLPKFQGSDQINSSVYDKVFEGDVNCKTLEDVYQKFNQNHPKGYKARSLSVSDVVEVIAENGESEFHFCDSFEFRKVDFEPEKCKISERFSCLTKEETVSVLFVPVGKAPVVMEIPNTYEAMKELVGGGLEEYMPFEDDAAIVCNRDGKQNDLPKNRAVYAEPQKYEVNYEGLKNHFRQMEREGHHCKGHIVFTVDTFRTPHSEFERTYEVSSDNKAFQPNMNGYSIYGASLDGVDRCLRMEGLMADEKGGKDGWKIEKCFIITDLREVSDIVHGDFFIARSNVADEKYDSLTPEQALKYQRLFRQPERFIETDYGIKIEPIKSEKADRER